MCTRVARCPSLVTPRGHTSSQPFCPVCCIINGYLWRPKEGGRRRLSKMAFAEAGGDPHPSGGPPPRCTAVAARAVTLKKWGGASECVLEAQRMRKKPPLVYLAPLPSSLSLSFDVLPFLPQKKLPHSRSNPCPVVVSLPPPVHPHTPTSRYRISHTSIQRLTTTPGRHPMSSGPTMPAAKRTNDATANALAKEDRHLGQ